MNYKICASDIKAQIKQVFDNFRNIIRIRVINQHKAVHKLLSQLILSCSFLYISSGLEPFP